MQQQRSLFLGLSLALLSLLLAATVQAGQPAQPPAPQQGPRQLPLGTAFTYQGRLLFDGAAISDTCAFRFNLYEDAGGTSLVGTPLSLVDIPVQEGYFTVQLDFGSGVFDGNARWLEVRVRCSGDADYTGLGLQELTAAPYALYALDVGEHDHWGESWSGTGTGLTLSNGDIGLLGRGRDYGVQGQTASTDGAGLYGLNTATTGFNYGVLGEAASTEGRGVYGQATAGDGTTIGVQGVSNSPSGIGVFGNGASMSGSNYGVHGQTYSPEGTGVFGVNGASSGTTYGVYGRVFSPNGRGVYGYASADGGATCGVCGQTDSASGDGVYGYASTSSGTTYGVRGQADSSNGRGVYGLAGANSGTTYGVYGQANSSSGRGVYGWASAGSGTTYGVYGQATSTGGYGVYGRATADSGTTYGVYGQAESSDGYGVYGSNLDGYAGFFQGSVHVNGSLSKNAGTFKIDHPLDPAGKYLYHSFVESPDMLNVYNGNVTLDGDGTAWVELPDWFESLNGGAEYRSDFRYQLTCVGGYAPVYIAREIEHNRFQIAGGSPGLKVSWLVTGIRHDPYAEAHRSPVEENKPADEHGTYLHPELYGQPEELGLAYRHRPGRATGE